MTESESESESSEPGSETDDPDPSDPTGQVFVDLDCGSGFRCSVTTCDIVEQDCPMGEKCTAYASLEDVWDATRCVPVSGDIEPGQPCSGEPEDPYLDDCDASGMCVDGVCRSFCTGTREAPTCGDGLGCGADDNEQVPLFVCLERCDPLAQDCASGACYWLNDQFLCLASGDFPIAEPCGYFVNDCQPGAACIDAGSLPTCPGAGCCSPHCNLEAPDCSGYPGTECVAWFEVGAAPVGLDSLGICLAP